MHRWKNLSSSTEAWEAIEALELVNIEVVSLTSDGTKQNRQFYSLCQIADDQSHNQLPYKTPSLYREHCNPCHRGGSNENPTAEQVPLNAMTLGCSTKLCTETSRQWTSSRKCLKIFKMHHKTFRRITGRKEQLLYKIQIQTYLEWMHSICHVK